MLPYTYLFINLVCISVPFAFSFLKKHAFYKEWKPFFLSCFLVAVFFLIWDEIFTQKQFWGFNSTYLTGIYMGHLPLEEILFFVCIPYACSFSRFAFQYYVPSKETSTRLKQLNHVLALFLIGLSMMNYYRWYSFLTFLLCGLFLLYLRKKEENLYYYYLPYICILPFFLVSNGILTGSFLEKPIVWYNNQENLGIRIFTIPLEDTFYGMLLIFSNFYFHQLFKQKWNAKS